RMARKPSAVARELLRNFPKPGSKRRRRRKGKGGESGAAKNGSPQREVLEAEGVETSPDVDDVAGATGGNQGSEVSAEPDSSGPSDAYD
ncbi:MAG: hypothetical protein M3331_04520, partial [Actinomycetota bacterium]|nr:hypothetical protein [Actinomycetota bacterium]